MKTSINDLKEKGFVVLPYPAYLRSSVEEAVVSWKKFCALPMDVKKGLPYSSKADGVGYELKEGAGNRTDRKENFDVAITGKNWLETRIKNPIVLEFMQNASALVEILKPIVLDFAKQSECAFDIPHFANEVDGGEDSFFVRFIHYFGDRKVGEEIGTTHTDRSGFTFHLFESAPGLQCLTYDGKWIGMPVVKGETVVIPSMQMQLRSKGVLRALCHRVIATPETANLGRYSAVCFVKLKNTPEINKDKQGRLQEKEPGFNYDMTDEEFSELFKK